MRIDLHCHTKSTKQGDGLGRNVSRVLFREKLELAEVKIVAITNHNSFDYEQYTEFHDFVSDFCCVWPGIELDIISESHFHLIVVTKPEGAGDFSKKVKCLIDEKRPDDFYCSIERVCEVFSSNSYLFIPHFHDKNPAISNADKEKLLSLVGDSKRVFIEPRTYRTMGVLANNDFNVIIGSDVKDWKNYEKCTFADLRLPVGNFNEFLMLAKRDTNVVNTLLNKKEPIHLNGKPHKTVSIPLDVFPDVNIIFGPKGTGKTEILSSLFSEMTKRGFRSKKYSASERGEEFSRLLDIKDMKADVNKVNALLCEEQFQALFNWTDSNPTDFSQYVNWYKTRNNSKSKARMKITEAVFDHFDEKDGSILKQEFESIKKIKTELSKIRIDEHLKQEEKETLFEIISKLEKQVYSKKKDFVISKYSSQLTHYTIKVIKKLADKKSDTVSRPSTAGLREYAEKRIELINNCNTILNNLNVSEFNEREKIGFIEDKGDVFINRKYRMLCPEERTTNYPGTNISALRIIKGNLEEICDEFLEPNVTSTVAVFSQNCKENKVFSTEKFLARSKQIVDKEGIEYVPSNGEKGIILLQHVLNDDADAYFLDEPELGMGNSYIDSSIRPLISDLAKQRKYVVVATHNANIAVRTLPYQSIYRIHEKGEYKTFVGNPFDDKLINVNNHEDVKSWTQESLHSLEGGHEAFFERKDIYESGDNHR